MLYRIWFVLSVMLISASALSQSDKELYEARCAACHQSSGEGSAALKAPNLSGLSIAYVARQLRLFRSDSRGSLAEDTQGQMMRAAALGLSDSQVDKLAGYVGSLVDVPVNLEKQSTGFRGRGLYSVCSSCHGAQGEGNEALGAPRIAQQYSWYLRSQLNSYKKGWRGGESGDELGRQMRSMALTVDDADLELLIRHVTGLGVKP